MDDKLVRQSRSIDLQTTNSSQENVKVIDRFHAVQQKLEKIAIIKSKHKQLNSQQLIASKLQAIQSKFIQESYCIEQKVELLKQMLIQMKILYQQRQKHSTNLKKQRENQIKQLKSQIKQAFQAQKRYKQQSQKSNIQIFCKDVSNIEESFENQVALANEQTTSMQYKFEHALPRLHQCIITSNRYLSCKIRQKIKEAIEQSKNYQQLVHIQQSHEEESTKQINQYISYAIHQIKQEINTQRQQRRSMKQKLQFIILTASKRIHKE